MSIPLPPPLTYLVPLYMDRRLVGHISSFELLLHSDLTAEELKAVRPRAEAAFNALRWQDPLALTDENRMYLDMIEGLADPSIDLSRFEVEDLPEAMRLLACAWVAARVANLGQPAKLRVDDAT
jgi:hypothetical protein